VVLIVVAVVVMVCRYNFVCFIGVDFTEESETTPLHHAVRRQTQTARNIPTGTASTPSQDLERPAVSLITPENPSNHPCVTLFEPLNLYHFKP